MQRILRLGSQQAVRLYRERHRGRLDGYDDIFHAVFFQKGDVEERAFHQRLRASAVFFQKTLFDAARVGANAHGDVMGADTVRHEADLLLPADVAGIEAHLVRAAFDGEHGKFRRKMDVRHHGQRGAFRDGADGARIPFVPYGDADDLAARLAEPTNLRERGGHVAGGRGGHRLYAHGRAAAQGNAADQYLSAHFSFLRKG